MRLRTILPVIFLGAAAIADADVVTNITFLSPSTIQAGGAVSVEFSVKFDPLPGSVGSTEFIDDNTANQVSSCTTDLNACNEIQVLTTDSTLSSVFAELFGANTLSGVPNFYPESNTGNFQFLLQYPIAGRWELTTAGAEQEQFSELECQTPWLNGSTAGAASCSTIQTVSFNGGFDPTGTPDVFVTVEPAVAVAPEPASFALLGVGLILIGSRRRAWIHISSKFQCASSSSLLSECRR